MKRVMFIVLSTALAASWATAEKPARPSGEEQLPGWVTNTVQSLDYGVLLEIEGFASKVGGENQSDILVATAAFDLEASMNEWLSGHVGLLWEQYSRETDNVDEAYVVFRAAGKVPFYLIAGRFYQPVGNFESVFISDPLTLELMEMNTESAMVGFDNGWLNLSAGAFKGDVKKGISAGNGGDATVSDFYVSSSAIPTENVQFGAYWLSDLMEGYNQRNIGALIADQPGYEKIGAAGAFINLYMGILTLNAEYVSALNDFNLSGGTYIPTAFNLEGSVLICEKVRVGLKVEGSNDLYAGYDTALLAFGDKFPGRAAGAVVSYAFHENARVAAEYLHVAEVDDHASGDVITVQLGYAF